jgi:hypothetical protein
MFHDWLPAETLQPYEELADAPWPLIRDRFKGIELEDEFFVLGSDPPVFDRLASFFKVLRELSEIGYLFRFT